MSKPTRFLLVSTHCEQTTGYSKVSHNLLKQLATLHPIVKVFHYGFQRIANVSGGIRKIENVIQYDAAANEDPKQQGFGFNKFGEYIDTVCPDIVMIYNDPIIVNQFLDSIKNIPKTFKLWVYLDMVYEHPDQGLIRNIENKSDRIFCFTENWKKHLLSRIPTTSVPIDVMEHGVDIQTYKPISDIERISIRKQMDIPVEATVFLNVNRNSERKRLDLSIMAFTRLLKNNPDKLLYLVMVTGMNHQAGAFYNPIQIFMSEIQRLGIDPLKYGQRVIIVDSNRQLFDDASINKIYNACDYGINTSNGEGFGLCQLEHIATGAPQVVINSGDYHAFLSKNIAEIIEPSIYSYLSISTGVGDIAKSASVEEVTEAMQRILLNKNSEECIKTAASRPWAKICDPFLELVVSHTNNNV
jgi:glycosyltransferase involved in cell wall biosynthesis